MATNDNSDIRSEEFRALFQSLMEAYKPALDQIQLPTAPPDELLKQAQLPPSCDEEDALATRIFEQFMTEETARRLLPAAALQALGPFQQWQWCLLHARCCMVLGWLLCRGPRTFRAYVDVFYRYWRCIRAAAGSPVAQPLAADERDDFQTLVSALAAAFRPACDEQLHVDAAFEDVLNGKIDCLQGDQSPTAVFERVFTNQNAPALLGKAAYERHSREGFFWFCRCWCLCSLRFGCCLARAHSIVGIIRCLLEYFRCLRECFQPLTCDITDPSLCVEEKEFKNPPIFRGVEIRGTATGVACSHYTLEWRVGLNPFNSLGIFYPGGGPNGPCGVVNGTLGWLQTMPYVPGGLVEIRLCVFSSQANVQPCCVTKQFELSKDEVYIRSVEGVEAPDMFDPSSQLTDAAGVVRSFGTSLKIFGSAVVGGCAQKQIKRYTLSFHPGFVNNPLLPAFVQFWQTDYITAFQIDSGMNLRWETALTAAWRQPNLPFFLCNPFAAFLQDTRWSTLSPVLHPITPSESPCPAPAQWTSTPAPLINCQSGRYTLRLTTEDTGGGIKHHLRQIWLDNKEISHSHAHITGILGVDPCKNIDLSDFAPPNGDCANPWIARLAGVAYDEYIEEGNTAAPSDNFGGYSLWIKKDGMPNPGVQIPIPGPGAAPTWSGSAIGTSRVGEPGDRCTSAAPPPGIVPPASDGILALLDMRRLDAICNPFEPQLTLKPGECCGYVITLLVWDNSVCPDNSGGRHQREHSIPLCICNHVRRQ